MICSLEATIFFFKTLSELLPSILHPFFGRIALLKSVISFVLNKKQVCEAIAARREEAENGGGAGEGTWVFGGVVLLISISPLLEKK